MSVKDPTGVRLSLSTDGETVGCLGMNLDRFLIALPLYLRTLPVSSAFRMCD